MMAEEVPQTDVGLEVMGEIDGDEARVTITAPGLEITFKVDSSNPVSVGIAQAVLPRVQELVGRGLAVATEGAEDE